MINDEAEERAPEPNWLALVPVANELQRWVSTMPVWTENSWETWADFSRRHAKDEQELAKRLSRMPGCTIARSNNGSSTTLSLAGVEVRSQGGLASACRDWIGRVRQGVPRGLR